MSHSLSARRAPPSPGRVAPPFVPFQRSRQTDGHTGEKQRCVLGHNSNFKCGVVRRFYIHNMGYDVTASIFDSPSSLSSLFINRISSRFLVLHIFFLSLSQFFYFSLSSSSLSLPLSHTHTHTNNYTYTKDKQNRLNTKTKRQLFRSQWL